MFLLQSSGDGTPANSNWNQISNTEYLEGFITGFLIAAGLWLITKIMKFCYKKLINFLQQENKQKSE